MPYDSRIPLKLQLLRAGLENEEDTAIFAYTTSTSYYAPSYFIGDAVDDPEMMDIQGALEETLHSLLDNGCTLSEACDVLGFSELPDDDLAEGEQVYIDNGVGIDGALMSLEKLDPESSDIHSLLSEQQIVNTVMAFDSLEPDDRLDAAERFATGDYTGWEAQEVCKAYRERLPKEAIDAIADHRLKHSEMRALIGIAGITEPSPDGSGEPQRPALRAVMEHFDEAVPKLHRLEDLAKWADKKGLPFDERWCGLDAEQLVHLRTAIAIAMPAEVIEAFSEGSYTASAMNCITVAYCGGVDGMEQQYASALLNPAYTTDQLWCLSSAIALHARGDISDAQLDFLCNPELPSDIMNSVRTCFAYCGLSLEKAQQAVIPGVTPEDIYAILDNNILNNKTPDLTADDRDGRTEDAEHHSTLREEASASREASGHLEADLPEDREVAAQEKE